MVPFVVNHVDDFQGGAVDHWFIVFDLLRETAKIVHDFLSFGIGSFDCFFAEFRDVLGTIN